ncbi:MAG: hypothetical protein DCC55_28165 [Chloroflexi bacterium]|nr:MAG: hypothetical protein DCC55_28165 [Chloroflexota bacterium]
MKQRTMWGILSLFLAGSLLLTGCLVGPLQTIASAGRTVTQEMSIRDFDRLQISHAFEVEVRQGEAFRVVVEVDEAVLPHLQVDRVGNTLRIGIVPGWRIFRGPTTLRAEVTMPTLAGLTASGAARVDLSGFRSSSALEIRASGASVVQGAIDAGDTTIAASGASRINLSGTYQDLAVEASGASDVTLDGSGQNLRANASGGSEVDLANLPVVDARLDASGASTIYVQLSGTLDVEASGASNIYYSGDPTLGDVSTSGASSISRR